MANTFKKIQTVTVGSGGAASIDFTSIPQTYTDLKIVVSARGTDSNTRVQIVLKFNGSSTGYSERQVRGFDANVASSTTGSTDRISLPRITAATATASVFSSNEYYIPNYASSNNKSVSVDSVAENNSSASWFVDLTAGLWSNSSAITSIALSCDAGNFAQYSTATLYGVSNVPAAGNAKATGGIITYDDTYVYHTFPWSGTFTPLTSLTADYLVVAGGGGAGGAQATDVGSGGGGAGGLRCTIGATGGGGTLESALSLTATAYTVTVGAGGAGGTNTSYGTDGSNSVFSTITSTGGGGGARFGGAGNTGGSGGGGGTSGGSSSGTTNQGFGGGAGQTGGNRTGGGGGGAGVAGTAGASGGHGGNGVTTSISGTSTVYAGGGGGGAGSAGAGGTGGTGGGGAGSAYSGNGNSATANTGGGGGGASAPASARTGGTGGSGIVIVRYAK
jgi:hypothetical protein